MTSKEKLRVIVEDLSEPDAEATLAYIERRKAAHGDPVLEILDGAAPDSEPTTPEEDRGAAEAREEYERGDFVEADEIKRDLG